MPNVVRKRLLSEAVGSFCLVFAGTGAIAANAGTTDGHVAVAITFGLVVFAMIAAVGDISGAHLNPAVTVGFWLARRFAGRNVPAYIASQCLGATAASVAVRLLIARGSGGPALGATVPSGSAAQAWAIEALLTLGLMLVILCVSAGAREKGVTAGLAIGAVVSLEALFAGPLTGASMNPARSLAPALISGDVAGLWIYLTAPVIGAAAAVPLCCGVREPSCCRGATKCAS